MNRCPRYRPLQDEIIAVALCQGAALHYVNGSNGIKDLDVWTFYAKRPTLIRYPRRGPSPRDFGDPRFGQSPDYPRYVSRKVDCFGCSIAFGDDRDPISALRSYLSDQRTPNARELARKAVVLIEPDALLGEGCVASVNVPAWNYQSSRGGPLLLGGQEPAPDGTGRGPMRP